MIHAKIDMDKYKGYLTIDSGSLNNCFIADINKSYLDYSKEYKKLFFIYLSCWYGEHVALIRRIELLSQKYDGVTFGFKNFNDEDELKVELSGLYQNGITTPILLGLKEGVLNSQFNGIPDNQELKKMIDEVR